MVLVGTSACTLDLAPVLGKAIRLREKEIRWVNMTAATQNIMVLLCIAEFDVCACQLWSFLLCSVVVVIIIEHCLIPAVHLFSWNTKTQLKQKLCESRTSRLNTDG